jgi:hypothetical protein
MWWVADSNTGPVVAEAALARQIVYSKDPNRTFFSQHEGEMKTSARPEIA